MSSVSEVVRETVRQVRAQVLIPRSALQIAIDDETVRFHLRGRVARNIDIRYDRGRDLYDVSIHEIRGADIRSEERRGLYADQLADCFPERLRMDANTRAFVAQLRREVSA